MIKVVILCAVGTTLPTIPLGPRAADLANAAEYAFQVNGGPSKSAHISRYGRFVVFQSVANDLVDDDTNANLLAFFHDRLKVYLRDSGARHDLIDAVISPSTDDLLTITRRVEALGSFLETEDGKNLLAGTKRAANIFAAEEKKSTQIADAVVESLLEDGPESSLYVAVNQAKTLNIILFSRIVLNSDYPEKISSDFMGDIRIIHNP